MMSKQLQETIDYIVENYGREYLTPLVVSKNIKNLKRVLPYIEEKGVIETIITSSAILSFTLEKIEERVAFV